MFEKPILCKKNSLIKKIQSYCPQVRQIAINLVNFHFFLHFFLVLEII